MGKKKLMSEQTIRHINSDGEVTEQTTIQTHVTINPEPNFVKLYLDTVLAINCVNIVLTPLMMEILNICTYANNKDGQIFHFTKYEKDFIAQKLNTTENYLKQQIIKLQKGGIVKRISHGVYAVNPFLFGKGEWKDIKKAQMTFDFAKKRIEVEFEHMEEGAENE